jgi:hypothetical protein
MAKKDDHSEKAERQPYRVRLPGFITHDEVGLGEVIKKLLSGLRRKPESTPVVAAHVVLLRSTVTSFSRSETLEIGPKKEGDLDGADRRDHTVCKPFW